MITHQRGLLARTVRAKGTQADDQTRERERLRRELLQRILDREVRRQALRGVRI
ncbi:MAG: hypothetical protein K8S94_00900 [Planctomycetia bacterium]|nr:hypothetical protein [Planctomycetia bacterium]